MRGPGNQIFEFEDFALDVGAAELRKAGFPISLEPQVLDLILILAQHSGRVVTRDEIIEKVWNGRIISESAISTRINAARKALGDDGTAQRVIKTIHGRGFRFELKPMVKIVDPDIAVEVAESSSLPDKPSIAVLAFENMSNDPDQEYFSDGIAEDIITALSRYNWFSVVARNSSFSYKGQSPDIRRVGEELGVQHVVEGSVRRSGSRVRISTQLVEALSGRHLWAERYDRELVDIFELQDEISANIAAVIEPELVKFESRRARGVSPDYLNAWDRYLLGIWHLYRFSKEDSDKARFWLNSAVEHHSEFAPALGLLAYLLALDVALVFADDVDDARLQALEYGRRAVAADPQDHLARHGLGRALAINGQSEQALTELRSCVALNPSFAQGYFSLGRHLTYAGQPREAIRPLERAISLSPNDQNAWGFFAMSATARLLLGEYELSVQIAEQSSRNNPSHFYPHLVRSSALGSLGRHTEARQAFETARTMMPEFSLDKLRARLDNMSEDTWNLFTKGLSAADVAAK